MNNKRSKTPSKNGMKQSWQGKSLRTTITMHRTLYRDVRKLMHEMGYGDNFSAFITQAARHEQARLRREQRRNAQ